MKVFRSSIKGILKGIGVFLIVAGLIAGIAMASRFAQLRAGVGAVCGIFIAYAGGGLLCSVMPFAIAEILGALETISDNQAEIPELLKKQLSMTGMETGQKRNADPWQTEMNGEAEYRKTLGSAEPQASAPSGTGKVSSKRLFANRTYENGPIVMRKADLLIAENATALKLELMNLSEKVITDVKIAVTAMDPVGDILSRGYEYLYMDRNVGKGQSFGYEQINNLPSAATRDASVSVVLVRFSDGSIWKPDNAKVVDYAFQGFNPADHEALLQGLENAKEIYDYVRSLDLTEDPVYTEELLPALEKISRLERLYGNMKEAALARINEIYAEG